MSAPSPPDVELALYTRAGCHLCVQMKREIDVDSDPVLAARYGESVPVLAIDGRVAFKVRLTAQTLAKGP